MGSLSHQIRRNSGVYIRPLFNISDSAHRRAHVQMMRKEQDSLLWRMRMKVHKKALNRRW